MTVTLRSPGSRLRLVGGEQARLWAVVFTVALLAGACSGGQPTSVESAPSPDEVELECGVKGHPCSLGEVPTEVLRQTDALGDEVIEMLDGGASVADAHAWLGAQESVVEVQSDDLVVRFRLDGGRETWIFGEGAFGTRGSPGPQGQGSSSTGGLTPTRAGPAPAVRIVAPGSEEKRALVLSPVRWEFGEFDDGAAVADILRGTRGYAGRVEFLANDSSSSSTVGIDSFKGWGTYDVVHVGTHGRRLCGPGQVNPGAGGNGAPGGCRAVIYAGTVEGAISGSGVDRLAWLAGLTETGVGTAKSQRTGVEYLILTADFFRAQYPSGLQDTVVFFNACQTVGSEATDLSDALSGSTSVFFGWTEAVFAVDAKDAAIALYSDLSQFGYTTETAHDRLKMEGLATGALAPEFADLGAPRLLRHERPDGDDLRIREVVTVMNPDTAEPLGPSDRVSIVGDAGDGEPDAAPYLVRIDGVPKEFAPETILHVSIDGVEAEPRPLSEGEAAEGDRWLLSGFVELPYDLEGDTPVDFRAWVELYSGGESRHEVVATLTGLEPIMGHVWEFDAVHVSSWSGAPFPTSPWTTTAHLVLGFEEGQDVLEPHPRYVVTGGTVTVEYSHVYGICSFTAEPFTFEVLDEHVETSYLEFDTTVSPVAYQGVIQTMGPEFTYSSVCDETSGTDSLRATTLWMLLLSEDDFGVVSGDNDMIVGTHLGGVDFEDLGYSFVQRSDYEMTRIR